MVARPDRVTAGSHDQLGRSIALKEDIMAVLAPVRFAVCIDTLFSDKPFEQRLEYVADLGFTAFEFWGRQGRDMNITLALKQALRLDVSAISGSLTSPIDPGQRQQFLADITQSAGLAVDLACANLIVTSGLALEGVDRDEQRANLIAALRAAAPTVADADTVLALKPLNPVDHPGAFVTTVAEASSIVREVNLPHVRLCFSAYEQQISAGNLTRSLLDNLDIISHIQVADVPGRHEPGTGEINFEYFFGVLREQGYAGFVGLEYWPQFDTTASLRAVRALAQ
jgi:hydroxypyruvate isomerase